MTKYALFLTLLYVRYQLIFELSNDLSVSWKTIDIYLTTKSNNYKSLNSRIKPLSEVRILSIQDRRIYVSKFKNQNSLGKFFVIFLLNQIVSRRLLNCRVLL